MELKAQYDLEDILDLIEQDLAAKGFRLAGGLAPDTNGHGEFKLTLAIEQDSTIQATPAPLALAPAPAPMQQPAVTAKENNPAGTAKRWRKQDLTQLSPEEAKAKEARRAQWREAGRAKREKKRIQQQAIEQVVEVVAPSTVPFQYQPALNGHNR